MNSTVIITSFAMAFMSAAGTMIMPFLPLYLLELGCTEENIGFWTAAVFSGMFLVGGLVMPLWGALSDRFGRKRMMLQSALGFAAAFFSGGFVTAPVQLLAMRLFQGFFFGFMSIGQALISASAGKKAGRALGLFLSGRSAGSIMGPFMGGLLAHWFGIRWSFILASMGAFFAFLLVAAFVKEPKGAPAARRTGIAEKFRHLSHNKTFLLMLAMQTTNEIAVFIGMPLIALHVGRLEGSLDDAAMISGLIMGAGGVAAMVSSPFWGWIGEKRGFARTMYLAFFGNALSALGQFLAPDVWLFGAAQFCFGFTVIGVTVSITGAISAATSLEERGSAFGLSSTALSLGNFIGPVIGGALMTFIDTGAAFLAAGMVQLLAGSFIFWKYGRESALSPQNGRTPSTENISCK